MVRNFQQGEEIMKKFELKFWHPVAGFALAKLLQRLNVNLIKLDFQPVLGDIITWIENLWGGLLFQIGVIFPSEFSASEMASSVASMGAK